MEEHQGSRKMTRRDALAMAAAAGVAPFAAAVPTAAEDAAPIMMRPIPRTSERLPVVGLGTAWKYGSSGPAITEQFGAVVHTLVEGGGRVVDTGSTYGQAERLLAAVLGDSALRQRIFVSTKLENDEITREGIQGSLRRLGVGKIDLMLVHNVASDAQSLAPLREWKAQGLVRYIGVSTSNARYFGPLEAVMRRERPDIVELNYSLGDREAERRVLPTAYELGIATLIDTPFGGLEDQRGNLFRFARTKPMPDWAREFGAASWAQFFLKFLLGHGAVTVVIPGTDNPVHMADNLAAGRGRLPDAAMRQRMVHYVESLA